MNKKNVVATTGSFAAPHYAGTSLIGAIKRAKDLLGTDASIAQLNQNQRLAWYLLSDACRLASTVHILVKAVKGKESEVSAEAVEVLTRKVLEHTIFLEYLHEYKQSDDLVRRFFAACRAAYARSNKVPTTKDDQPPNWPNYEEMAKTQQALHDIYKRFSYLAHPKTSIPYTLLEHDSGQTLKDFFKGRAGHATSDLAQVLHIATDNAWAIGVKPAMK